MKVRTTAIVKILKGDLDALYYLTKLEIEANHYLEYLEPGLFRNISRLEQLSISFNSGLKLLREGTFEGLPNLKNLTLVSNLFKSISSVTSIIKPDILPSLEGLDISEKPFVRVLENDFTCMEGSKITMLEINLCSLEYIHPNSFISLKMLKELRISQNNLKSYFIGSFLIAMQQNGINLTYIDLSGMGFRKQPPRRLLDIIANSTISKLMLADNHFEVIFDDTFPAMPNIEEVDLSRICAMSVGPNAFDPIKFPNLQVLLLSGNNFRGLGQINRPGHRLEVLDVSSSGDRNSDKYYYEMTKDIFIHFGGLKVLNLASNGIKSIYNYTFNGLDNLRILKLENTSLYYAAEGSFLPVRHLQYLNLANNPLGRVVNLTGNIFKGLDELKVLNLENCGIDKFDENDNLFQKMPNIVTLILRKNLLRYVGSEILKPLKKLYYLDLRENFLISWSESLFLSNKLRPTRVYLANNKITHFTTNMLLDIDYLLSIHINRTVVINLVDNVFNCDCNSMYETYLWLKVNGSRLIKHYINNSQFLCDNSGNWEGQRVAMYLKAIPSLRCSVYSKSLTTLLLVWSAPTLVTIVLIILIIVLIYKYRVYISYWIFISKVALGRRFIGRPTKAEGLQRSCYKYDAFVSYSNEDKDFVAKMVSYLESSPPHVKLCIFERDFEIGSFISESVSNSINESRYIILVISNNFAKSQWCRWETHLAEYHRLFLEDGTSYDPLVLIKIGDIESKYMTTTLKYLLKTKIYHTWKEDQSREFWMKLKKVIMKRRGENCQQSARNSGVD